MGCSPRSSTQAWAAQVPASEAGHGFGGSPEVAKPYWEKEMGREKVRGGRGGAMSHLQKKR